VRAIEPHTEAHPVAPSDNTRRRRQRSWALRLLPGRSDRHPLNLFVVLVGISGKGPKGTSWGRVRQIMAAAEPSWSKTRVTTGLASGEGVIWAVRDPIMGVERQGKGAAILSGSRLRLIRGSMTSGCSFWNQSTSASCPSCAAMAAHFRRSSETLGTVVICHR
jgi:hypothetical protein